MSIKRILPIAIFLLLAILLWRGLSIDGRLIPSVLVDKTVPTFELPGIDNSHSTLSNLDLTGEVSLLNVFASWCGACYVEHAELMEISFKYLIPVYGLNYKDEKTDAQGMLKRYGNPYRKIGFDAKGRVGIDFGVYGTPETYVIDKRGVIRYKQVGPMSKEIFEEKIFPLIKKLQRESA